MWRNLKRQGRGGTRKEGTYLNMHRRFPGDMQSNLGESLHVLKSRRFVRSEGMCSGIYYQLLSSLTYSRPRVLSREWWREGGTYNVSDSDNPVLYNARSIPEVASLFQAGPRMGVGPIISCWSNIWKSSYIGLPEGQIRLNKVRDEWMRVGLCRFW